MREDNLPGALLPVREAGGGADGAGGQVEERQRAQPAPADVRGPLQVSEHGENILKIRVEGGFKFEFAGKNHDDQKRKLVIKELDDLKVEGLRFCLRC